MKAIEKLTKKFMLDLAKQIYDSKNRCYLNLCQGTLQNGPDPKDKQRIMHCGLGELYFAMTGKQPEVDNVSESDVVHLAASLVDFDGAEDKRRKAVAAQIKKLKVDEHLKAYLLDTANDYDPGEDPEAEFIDLLENIPSRNDGSETYKERAQEVARTLKEAAEYLPE